MWRLMVCRGSRTAANVMVSAATMTGIASRFVWIRATVQRRIGEDRRVFLDQHTGVAEVINEHFSEKLGLLLSWSLVMGTVPEGSAYSNRTDRRP
jgi:hypothetical protein